MKDPIATFDDFWPHYLRAHSDTTNQALHVAGVLGAAATLGVAAATRRPKLALLAPIICYGPALLGHAMFQNNRPTELEHPIWSLIGDCKMTGLSLTGQLAEELRLHGVEKPRQLSR